MLGHGVDESHQHDGTGAHVARPVAVVFRALGFFEVHPARGLARGVQYGLQQFLRGGRVALATDPCVDEQGAHKEGLALRFLQNLIDDADQPSSSGPPSPCEHEGGEDALRRGGVPRAPAARRQPVVQYALRNKIQRLVDDPRFDNEAQLLGAREGQSCVSAGPGVDTA